MPFGLLDGSVHSAILVLATGLGVVILALAMRGLRRRMRPDEETDDTVNQLRDTVVKQDSVALVIPEGGGIDSLAAALGMKAIINDWGVNAELYIEDPLTGEDSKLFSNMFDIEVDEIDDTLGGIAKEDIAIAVGGGGAVPKFGRRPPVLAVIRHRPSSEENVISLTRTDYGATSTIVTELVQEYDVLLDQREATALLYGVRAGTRDFRRANGEHDYKAAGYLHQYADLSQIEDLRSPRMSADTFDVLGRAISNRERESSFVVSNAYDVPSISALEESADQMLRLEGVSTACVFGVYEDTIIVSCRAEDVRTSAVDLLTKAFDEPETTGGTTDAATTRIPLGIFAGVDEDREDTLDDLIETSARRALFETFEKM